MSQKCFYVVEQGILYSGKKVDTWFSVDKSTGKKFGSLNYLGEYSVFQLHFNLANCLFRTLMAKEASVTDLELVPGSHYNPYLDVQKDV